MKGSLPASLMRATMPRHGGLRSIADHVNQATRRSDQGSQRLARPFIRRLVRLTAMLAPRLPAWEDDETVIACLDE